MIDVYWSIFDCHGEGRSKRTELKQEIHNVLLYNPYASAQKISKIVKTDRKTVKKVLFDELNMLKVNWKWIPHILSKEIKVVKFEILKELCEFLTNVNYKKLHKVLTQDETWVCYSKPSKLNVVGCMTNDWI